MHDKAGELTELVRRAEPLVRRLGLTGPLACQPLAGGRNNRVYRLTCGTRPLLLKWYYADPARQRDRLAAEFAFAQYAWAASSRAIAEPLASDSAAQLALYEWIEGRHLAASEIAAPHLQSAAAFIAELNAGWRSAALAEQARGLPDAAEACFSEREHLQCVERRVAQLANLEPQDGGQSAARDWVRRELVPRLAELGAKIESDLRAHQHTANELLPLAKRCISPSDFGFHNALLRPSGEVAFVDFEYAGWDDPAKLVADFCCQVEVPPPRALLPEFQQTIAELFPHADQTLARIGRLLPLYRLKWCCIILNDFLPAGAARRRFGARPPAPPEQQLRLAADCLAAIDEPL